MNLFWNKVYHWNETSVNAFQSGGVIIIHFTQKFYSTADNNLIFILAIILIMSFTLINWYTTVCEKWHMRELRNYSKFIGKSKNRICILELQSNSACLGRIRLQQFRVACVYIKDCSLALKSLYHHLFAINVQPVINMPVSKCRVLYKQLRKLNGVA